MKKKLGILWLVAIILLSFNACDNGSTSGDDNKGEQTSDPNNPTGSDDTTEDYEDTLDYAVRLFEDLDIDGGIKQINKAYANMKNDTTKMYYALAKLALISTNADTVKFMRETCGFESYPNKLNSLIDTDWWEDCLKDDFVEKVVKANSEGLNNALNELLKIFTTTYDEVVEISKGMGQSTVTLPAKLIEALELEELFGDSDIFAGKAELDVVIAAMGLVKGGLEYISAFDWTFDASSITDMDVDDFITAVQSGTKLLTTPNKDRLDLSKKSFLAAVNLAMSSYDYIIGNNEVYPTEIKDTLKEYNIFYEAAKAFKEALEKGGTFYVPDADILELNKWPTNGSNYIVKIDCNKMFSSRVLDNAIEKDSSGKVKFYTNCSWWYEYYDDGWKWFESETEEIPLSGSFYPVHERNVAEVRTKIPESERNTYWDCDTHLLIKVRLPDFITISGIEDNERETFWYVWDECSDNYEYE